jgi:hypothetical protein
MRLPARILARRVERSGSMKNGSDDMEDSRIYELEAGWQWDEMVLALGDEEVERVVAEANEFLDLKGLAELTPEQAEERMAEAEDKLLRAALAADDAAVVTAIESQKEARAKHHSNDAGILASSAALSFANGTSAEEWIGAVLARYSALDDTMRLDCMTQLLALWKKGPWPWPRDED